MTSDYPKRRRQLRTEVNGVLVPGHHMTAEEFTLSLVTRRENGALHNSLLEDAFRILASEQIDYSNPGYLGLYNSAPTPSAMDVSAVEFALNAQAAGASESPLLHGLEEVVTQAIARCVWKDLADAGGILTSGGAMSNLLAVVAALECKSGIEWRACGIRRLPRVAVYTTELCHATVRRAVRLVGLGDEAIRIVPAAVISNGGLECMLAQDRDNGIEPLMFVGTVGDTVGGESDLKLESARAIRRLGVHLHVDAAWAGALIVLDHYRSLLEVLDEADSVTIDMHKWPGLPFGTSVFLLRDWRTLKRAFTVDSDYAEVGDRDLADCGVEWSRRSRSLAVWWRLFLFQEEFEEVVTRHFRLASYLREGLAQRGWHICNDTAFPVVCFSHLTLTQVEASILASKLLSHGIFVSACNWRQSTCIRAAMINANTTLDNIDALLAGLGRVD